MSLHSTAAAIAMTLAATLIAAPASAEWLEAKSKHFTVVGDLSEKIMRLRVDRLERFDAVMRLLLPKSTESNLPVLIVPTATQVRELAHVPMSSGVEAYFSPSEYGVFAVAPATIDSDFHVSDAAVLYHEYVHHLLMGSLDDPMPRWMNEGMAELFSNCRLDDDGSVTIGLGNSARAYSLVRVGRWSVQRLLDSDRNPPSQFDVDQMYAKSWLLLHYLLFSGQRQGEFGKFTAAMKRGLPQMDAAREAFGDLGKLDADLEYYRERKTLPALRIPKDKLAASGDITVRHLTPAEAAIMPLRMRSMAGVTPVEAQSVAAKARPIAAQYPEVALVQRAMAEMEFDARSYDAADQAIDRALAAQPDFVDAMALKGLLIGARAKRENAAALWPEARTWIVKANRAQPDNPFALMLYYDSFSAAGERPTPAAVAGLMRAIVLQPAYQELRVKVAAQLIATGDIKGARGVLAPVAFAPHRDADNPYAKLLADIDQGTSGPALTARFIELKIATPNLFVQQDPPRSP